MKTKINLLNIKSYLVGNFRYRIHGTKFQWLIRKHILEQIDWRIKVMDKTCYSSGSCIICGCSTTALQMSEKHCDKPCYPSLLSRTMWEAFKVGGIYLDKKLNIKWQIINGVLTQKRIWDL
jgi:hypothetical protein